MAYIYKPHPTFNILQIKRNSDGSVDRFKARIVANGQLQRENDYTNEHTTVLEFSVLLLFLSLELNWKLERRHVDVKTAIQWCIAGGHLYYATKGAIARFFGPYMSPSKVYLWFENRVTIDGT